MKHLLIGLTLLYSLSASALQIPEPSKNDPRVRFVNFDSADVVQIVNTFGYQTSIYFDDNEVITDMGGGDQEGWDIGVVEKKNGFFIKPKANSPRGNLSIVTNVRKYNFDLVFSKSRNSKDLYYAVYFRYPSDAKEAQRRAFESGKREGLLKGYTNSRPKNLDYWACGSTDITPTAAWDDSLFTYLIFPPNVDLPAIYYVNEDKSESLLNSHIDPDTGASVIQRVSKKLVLRRGNSVTCITNQAYDPVGTSLPNKTVSPDVFREVRDGDAKKASRK